MMWAEAYVHETWNNLVLCRVPVVLDALNKRTCAISNPSNCNFDSQLFLSSLSSSSDFSPRDTAHGLAAFRLRPRFDEYCSKPCGYVKSQPGPLRVRLTTPVEGPFQRETSLVRLCTEA